MHARADARARARQMWCGPGPEPAGGADGAEQQGKGGEDTYEQVTRKRLDALEAQSVKYTVEVRFCTPLRSRARAVAGVRAHNRDCAHGAFAMRAF